MFNQKIENLQGLPTLAFNINNLLLRSPVMPASGCFGPQLGSIIPSEELGAVVTKTIFFEKRAGNPPDRISEIPYGVVNSVGIPSIGIDGYLETLAPLYRELPVPTIVSLGGFRASDFARLAEILSEEADAFELNVSCPNLEQVDEEIGSNPNLIYDVVKETRKVTNLALILKLSPMVTSIADCALAAQEAGADAVCVSNSIPCLPIKSKSLHPVLGNYTGGLSGPAIKPIVLRLVQKVSNAIDIPIIGCGGIMNLADVLEYLSVGASAVQVGTINFTRPAAMIEIVRQLKDWCDVENITSYHELRERVAL